MFEGTNCDIIFFMKTIINKIDKHKNLENDKMKNLIEGAVNKAGTVLRDGGLVAFPTETVYGLGADALNEQAAQKTYLAKGRPSDNPLIIHISDLESLPLIAKYISPKAEKVARRFWPGPLTIVFEKTELVPYGTTGGLETVAVRMPDHELARAIITAGGGFISAPSANVSGRPSPTKAEHVVEDLDGKIEMVVDGGDVQIGVESTIVDMTSDPPMILRPGAITQEMLSEVIGEVIMDQALLTVDTEVAPKAPGMKYRHYAPKAKLVVIDGEIRDCIKSIRVLLEEAKESGINIGVIGTEESIGQYTSGIVKCIGSRENKETIAQNLYTILREFDQENVDIIYSEPFFVDNLGDAIMNRLMKAAGQHTLKAIEVISNK